MTKEEAQKLIEEGNKSGDFAKVAKGLQIIQELEQKANEDATGITTIKRTNPQGSKNYGRKESINTQGLKLNMFNDDGTEHKEDKLRKEDKGAWGVKARPQSEFASVVCADCQKEYYVPKILARKIERNPDGSMHNANVCDDCVVRRKRRV